MIAELVWIMLGRQGYEVFVEYDGFHAVKTAQRERPDLVLCDLALSELHGLDVARYLKQDPRTCDIPLIAMSAHTRKGIQEETRQAGFQAYLHKPFRVEQLLAVVQQFLPD